MQREKSISLDASLNEKRIIEEKDELLKTEQELSQTEVKSQSELNQSKASLKQLQLQLDEVINPLIADYETKKIQNLNNE